MVDGILKGIRVLDFTWVLAGPFATRLLADFGAEVIKVQSLQTAKGTEANLTGTFAAWNRNKRSITLDMSRPEARAIALRLARISDCVVENFAPRVMENWGLDYEKLKEGHPGLVMLSLSTMGQTGPWRDFVGFGQTVQALSGLTWLTSADPEAPAGLGFAYADPVSGLYGVLALLAALEHRDRTGQGRYIDLAEYEAITTLVGPALLEVQRNGSDLTPPGRLAGESLTAPHGCYRCAGTDRWCVIAVLDESQWPALCEAMGAPGLAREARFATGALRKAHEDELDRLIGQWTARQSAEQVVALLDKAGVPAGVVQDAEDLAQDPHLAARRFFVRMRHPVLGETVDEASPIRFVGEPSPDWQPAPLLGEGNRYVLGELLGLSEAECARLAAEGVVR